MSYYIRKIHKEYDSGIVYSDPKILKNFLINETGKIELFSLCDYRGLCYYVASESHQLVADPRGPRFYTIDRFLILVSDEELEKWKVTGMRKDSTTGTAEIYIKRIVPDFKVDHCPDKIQKITLNGPATIIFWKDGTKTVVKCDDEDTMDKEKGILYAAVKKLSTKETYNDILRMIDMLKGDDSL